MKKLLLFFLLLLSLSGQAQRSFWINAGTGGAGTVITQSANYGTYVRTITVDNTGNTKTLNDCQVKLTLTSSNFDFTHAKSDGSDIRITGPDHCTLLPYWMQAYDNSGQTATIWVKAQGVAAASTVTFYLYYGNAGASAVSSYTNTMSPPIKEFLSLGVFSFPEGTGATSATQVRAGSAATLNGTYTWVSDLYGGSGNAVSLDGSSAYIQLPVLLNTVPTSGCITVAFSPLSGYSNSGNPRIFSKGNTSTNLIDCYISASTGAITVRIAKTGITTYNIVGTTTTFTVGQKYEVALTWNPSWICLYVNGLLEAKVFNVMPLDGTLTSLTFGGLKVDASAVANFLKATFDDIHVLSRCPLYAEILAMAEKRRYYQKDEPSKWVKKQAPGFSPGGLAVYEPSLIYESGTYKLWYSKLFATSRESIYYATTTDLASGFTEVQRVLGAGTGGESLDATRSSILKDGSTYYLYYIPHTAITGTGVPNHVYVATSSDGITFSSNQIALNKGSNAGFQNNHVIKVGSTYHMYYDIDDGGVDVNDRYKIGHATASSPLGPFTEDSNNPLQSANYGLAATVYGAPWSAYIGSTLYMWFLATPPEEGVHILPSEIYRSNSTNFYTFTKPYAGSVIKIDSYPDEYDQVSDPSLLEENGNTWIASADNDNGVGTFNGNHAFKGVINFHKFNGTLTQLVTDLTLTVGAETIQ